MQVSKKTFSCTVIVFCCTCVAPRSFEMLLDLHIQFEVGTRLYPLRNYSIFTGRGHVGRCDNATSRFVRIRQNAYEGASGSSAHEGRRAGRLGGWEIGRSRVLTDLPGGGGLAHGGGVQLGGGPGLRISLSPSVPIFLPPLFFAAPSQCPLPTPLCWNRMYPARLRLFKTIKNSFE